MDRPLPVTDLDWSADRAREIGGAAIDVWAELLERIRELPPGRGAPQREVAAAMAWPVPDAPWFPQDVDAWTVRWVWWHLVEELSRHAGHGDIVRETVDGATMYALVAARDGLPDLPWLKAWKPAEATVSA